MIRLATINDMERMLEIYACAKVFMRENGNPEQWNGAYPDVDTLLSDIEKRQLYVMEENGHLYGCFALIGGEDPTYAYIEGKWRSDTPYGTIHRIASDGSRRGVFHQCVTFARETYDHLRVDTHEDNVTMQCAAQRNGFRYTGIIYLEDGSPRLAYEWLQEKGETRMSFETLQKSLEKKGYIVTCFDTAAEAARYLNAQIDGKTVGFGGSMTLKEMGVYETLSAHNEVYWHWMLPEGKTAKDICEKANAAQVYLSSVNGIAESGEIINIDGTCNRVAGMLYGHEKVYLVVGENKVAADYDGALHRARNIAAPRNAKRLNMQTPCAEKGERCYDCKSAARICRALSVFWEKPGGCAYEVVLIKETLGY